jgi:hypothetical protein
MVETGALWGEIARQAKADAIGTWLLLVALEAVSKGRETALVQEEHFGFSSPDF